MSGQTTTCDVCNVEYGIGDSPFCRDKHKPWNSGDAACFDAVVIYQDPRDGSFRVPGATASATTQMYDRHGFTRIECKTLSEVRRVTAIMNARDKSKVDRKVERACQAHEERVSEMRRELRRQMDQLDCRDADGHGYVGKMLERGRALARVVMERNNAKGPRSYDPGSHFEFAEMDSSNRERDPRGRK